MPHKAAWKWSKKKYINTEENTHTQVILYANNNKTKFELHILVDGVWCVCIVLFSLFLLLFHKSEFKESYTGSYAHRTIGVFSTIRRREDR